MVYSRNYRYNIGDRIPTRNNEYMTITKQYREEKTNIRRYEFICSCGYSGSIRESNIVNGRRCKKCANMISSKQKRYSLDDINKVLASKGSDSIAVEGEYKNYNSKITFKCLSCGKMYESTYNNVKGNVYGCEVCRKSHIAKEKAYTLNEVKNKLKTINPNIRIISNEYINAHIKLELICDVCGYEWKDTWNSLKNGCGCPVCSNHKIIKGINDIATTNPELVCYFADVEDTFNYCIGTNKRLNLKCNICGTTKKIQPINLTKYGFSCPKCGDKIPLTEKIMYFILEELNVNFIPHYRPCWAKGFSIIGETRNLTSREYDFYIPKYNMIIETHGEQHYVQTNRKGARTLEEEQKNDKYKKELALKNGVDNYVVIDCRKSDISWILTNIKNSYLNQIFELEKINWKNIKDNVLSNFIVKVCNLWNEGNGDLRPSEIAKILKINENTIRKYLKTGNAIGLCKYNPKEEMKKSIMRNGKMPPNKLICLDNGYIFQSTNECLKMSIELFGVKMSKSMLQRACRGVIDSYKGYHFKYVKDLSEEEKIKYGIIEEFA